MVLGLREDFEESRHQLAVLWRTAAGPLIWTRLDGQVSKKIVFVAHPTNSGMSNARVYLSGQSIFM